MGEGVGGAVAVGNGPTCCKGAAKSCCQQMDDLHLENSVPPQSPQSPKRGYCQQNQTAVEPNPKRTKGGADLNDCFERLGGPKRAVVFDLDETAGAWGLGSLAYRMCRKFSKSGQEPPVDIFVDHYLKRGGARPWLSEVLQTLAQWKQIGRIDEVGIFTAASNSNGWVTFVQKCMEAYAQTPGLFQSCYTREHSPLAVTEQGARTIKDLSLVSPDAEHVVLIDDKPDYALNGYVIGVPEYLQDVCITDLKNWMISSFVEHAEQIEAIFANDAADHPPNEQDFSSDNALWNAREVLYTIFPEPVAEVAES